MAYGRAANRYAKSIIDLSIERGSLEEVKKDMEYIHNTCVSSRELVLMLESPIIKSEKKLSVLKAVFDSNVSELTVKFIELLVEKGREALIDDIAGAFEEQYLFHSNILKAVVKSVNGVNDTIKARIEELIKKAYGKSVQIEEELDPSLIGGFILTVGDQQIDASISRKLAELEKGFSDNLYVKEY